MSKGTMNKAIIIGRLGKDPEIRNTQSGSKVASFSVATNHSQKDENGQWAEKTEWHNAVVFGNRAEFAENYLTKGKLVYLEGRLNTNSWEDSNGQKRYKTEIIVNELQMLGSKSDSYDGQTAEPVTPSTPPQGDSNDDILPF